MCVGERERLAWVVCAGLKRAVRASVGERERHTRGSVPPLRALVGWRACKRSAGLPMGAVRYFILSSPCSSCVCVSQVAWRKLETTLSGRDVAYVAVDGASSPPVRKALWEISGKREYPQVFLPSEGGAHTFAGGMDDIQEVSPRLPTSDVTHTPPPVVCMGWP